MKQFGRKWQLDIIGAGDAFSIDKLRVAFEIERTINEKPNPAKIQIWNLNRNHMNQLLAGAYSRLELKVGYEQLQSIYTGDISRVQVRREGLDFIVEMECGDGRVAYTHSRVMMSLKAGTTEKQIVEKLQGTLIDVQNGPTEIINNRALPRGKVLHGDTRHFLNICARNNRADWSIQNGHFLFLPKNSVIGNEITLLSQETGMINAPEQTDDGLELSCLLNPNLQIGGLVQVRSILEYFNGEYKIVKLAHSGDGLGGDWISRLTVVGGKFNKVK